MLNIEGFLYRQFDDDVVLYGSPVTDLRVCCPKCSARYGKIDTDYKLHVSIHKHTCHCFRCGYSRSWIGLVMDLTGMPYHQAVGELYAVPRARSCENIKEALSNRSVVRAFDKVPKTVLYRWQRAWYPKGFVHLCATEYPAYMDAVVGLARNYLRGRGFYELHWEMYGLGVAIECGFRVVIPIEESFWQARAIFPFVEPKYLHPKMETRRYIFNYTALDLYNEVVIAEGAFSAMAIGKNAIGLLRNRATDEQFERLVKSHVKKFVVALDSDATKNAMDLARALARKGKKVELWAYKDGDPADGAEFVVMNFDEDRLKNMVGIMLS